MQLKSNVFTVNVKADSVLFGVKIGVNRKNDPFVDKGGSAVCPKGERQQDHRSSVSRSRGDRTQKTTTHTTLPD
jgi:hypothetical protein